MNKRRAILLLEVLLGLALLASLGVWLLQIEAQAVRQFHQSQEREQIASLVEDLLWTWSAWQVPVTLPATGQLSERWHWRRELRPVRVKNVLCTQVSLIVSGVDGRGSTQELYRVDWLVQPNIPRGKRP